jgi:hypothetical protein
LIRFAALIWNACIPLASARSSSASQIRCTWLPWIDRWTIRNRSRSSTQITARRSARHMSSRRSRPTRSTTRSVTCTG